jgi:hypothetical protein
MIVVIVKMRMMMMSVLIVFHMNNVIVHVMVQKEHRDFKVLKEPRDQREPQDRRV